MAVKSRAVTVTTSATALTSAATDSAAGQSHVFYNNGAVIIYWGGSDVTTANGLPVAPGTYSPSIDLQPGEAVYGVTGSATAEARVGESGI